MQMMSQKAYRALSDQTLLESHELNILGYLPELGKFGPQKRMDANQWIDENLERN